jgi:hypothetical protein
LAALRLLRRRLGLGLEALRVVVREALADRLERVTDALQRPPLPMITTRSTTPGASVVPVRATRSGIITLPIGTAWRWT